MTEAEVLQVCRDPHALLDGHFLLRSGLHSRQYFQCALDARHVFVEKNAAGKLELRRGFQIARGEKLLVVEDVVTKGGRVQETIDIVRGLGGDVVGVATLVDRSGGKVDFGVRLETLLRLTVDAFDPATCPLCKAGAPVTKPGS